MIVLLLEGPEIRSGGGAGGFEKLEEESVRSSSAGAWGGDCLNSGAGLKEGTVEGTEVVWRSGLGWKIGCAMNTRGWIRATGELLRFSSSDVWEKVEKLVKMGSR